MTSSPDAAPLRVVFFSHDSQGLGHFRRNRALAHAMARRIPELTGRSVTGLLVNGVAEANPASFPDGFDVVTLPAISKTGRQYGARRLDVDMDAVTRLRAEIWDATLRGFRPDLVVVDRHAFGVKGELEEGLRQLRRHLPGCRRKMQDGYSQQPEGLFFLRLYQGGASAPVSCHRKRRENR